MDITRSEMVGAGLDRLITKRHRQRVATEGERTEEDSGNTGNRNVDSWHSDPMRFYPQGGTV